MPPVLAPVRPAAPRAALPPALALVPGSGRPQGAPPRAPAPLLDAWLAGLAPRSRETYRRHAAAFAQWLGVALPDLPAAFLDHGPGPANSGAREYRGALVDRGLAPATINVALTALASVVRVARTTGRIAWALEVPRLRVIPYRDTRGPGREAVRALLAAAAAHRNPRRGAQAVLVIRLLHDLALRCAEVAALELGDVELDAAGQPVALHVRGKGQGGARDRLALPTPTATALDAWLRVRGAREGRVVRLSRRGVAKLLERTSRRAGLRRPVACHQLRRQAVNEGSAGRRLGPRIGRRSLARGIPNWTRPHRRVPVGTAPASRAPTRPTPCRGSLAVPHRPLCHRPVGSLAFPLPARLESFRIAPISPPGKHAPGHQGLGTDRDAVQAYT